MRSIRALPVIVVNTHYHHHTGNKLAFCRYRRPRAGCGCAGEGRGPGACAQFMSYVGDVIEASSAAAVVADIYFSPLEGASMPSLHCRWWRSRPALPSSITVSIEMTPLSCRLLRGSSWTWHSAYNPQPREGAF